ncbi:MAG: hypothetical protein O3B41_02220 [Bacteroidetes bacterium]|nr:hypothetical protein [Bacteroidota bacterium]
MCVSQEFTSLRVGLLPSLFGFLLMCGLFGTATSFAQSQSTSDLLTYYTHARTRQIATEFAQEGKLKLEFKPLEFLDTRSFQIHSRLEEMNWNALLASLPEPLETFGVRSVRLISNLESVAYDQLFVEVDWSFVGSSSRSPADTLKTADIRGRLEYHFGPPTRTLAEMKDPEDKRREDIILFEYWFLVNGDIPVIILDVNGPWDRGIVLAAEMKYRLRLDHIKKEIMGQLIARPDRKPFVDYFFNFDQRQWYVTGFDGATFFDKRIERPNLNMGRPSTSYLTERITDN